MLKYLAALNLIFKWNFHNILSDTKFSERNQAMENFWKMSEIAGFRPILSFDYLQFWWGYTINHYLNCLTKFYIFASEQKVVEHLGFKKLKFQLLNIKTSYFHNLRHILLKI